MLVGALPRPASCILAAGMQAWWLIGKIFLEKSVLLEQVARQDAHMQKASKLPPPQHHPLGKEKTKGTSTSAAS